MGLFGIFAIVNGALNLSLAVRGPAGEARWGWLVFESIASIVAGGLTLIWPGVTALLLVVLVGAWAVVTGVAQVAAAFRLRRHVRGEWLLALLGVLSIVFGLISITMPAIGALTIALWIGAYAFMFGVLLIALALRLRSVSRTLRHEVPGGIPAAP